MIPLRLYAYVAIALALAGLATYGIHVWRMAERVEVAEKALVIERQQHKADNEKAARDVKFANEVSNGYQSDLRRLELERSNVPVVRLCKSAARVPAASPAASGPDPAESGRISETTSIDLGPDIGPALIDYGIACEANALQLDRLIQWVKAR